MLRTLCFSDHDAEAAASTPHRTCADVTTSKGSDNSTEESNTKLHGIEGYAPANATVCFPPGSWLNDAVRANWTK